MERIGLVTKEPIKLLITVLRALEGKVRLSLEGQLTEFSRLERFARDLEPSATLLRRNSHESATEFRIFELDEATKESFVELLQEHQSREKDLVHVEIEQNGHVVFSAIDNFAYDCVFLDEVVGKQVAAELLDKGYVSQVYEPPNYPQHPFLSEYVAENPHLAEVFKE